MHSPEYNLTLVQTMLEEIEDYLLSTELFWPLNRSAPRGMPPFPRLTSGGLLLALDQLDVQSDEMTPAQIHARQKCHLQLERVTRKWSVAMEGKTAHELRSRLNLWSAYVSELIDQAEPPDHYAYEVRHRVMFERLIELASRHPQATSHVEAMSSVDTRLRTIFAPGEFLWDERLRARYPRTTFWFLYGHPLRIRE